MLMHSIRAGIVCNGYMINEAVVMQQENKCISITMLFLTVDKLLFRRVCFLSFDAYKDEDIYRETLFTMVRNIEDKVEGMKTVNSIECEHHVDNRITDIDNKHIYCGDCGLRLEDCKYEGMPNFDLNDN